MAQFEGFEASNTTPVPDILFDELLTELTGAELKILLYIIRRTKGFKKDTDAISLTQLQSGITTKDGKVLDKGCGIKRRDTIVECLASLEGKNCITVKKGNDPQGDKATTIYGIKFKEVVSKPDYPSNITGLPVVTKPDYRSHQTGLGVVTKPDLQETVIHSNSSQQTELQQSSNASATASASKPSIKPIHLGLQSKPLTLETFNYDQPATIENIMLLGNCWRGGTLPVLKRQDSAYQKALQEGATPLSQRQRKNGQKGYSLREIDATIKFYKRIAPEGKPWLIAEEWWEGKSTDLWVIAKNIDKALVEIAKLELEHGNAINGTGATTTKPERSHNLVPELQAAKNRLRMFRIAAAKKREKGDITGAEHSEQCAAEELAEIERLSQQEQQIA